MKHWDHLSAAERQERLGDASIDRSLQCEEYETELVYRFENGLPLSKDGARRARKLLKGRRL